MLFFSCSALSQEPVSTERTDKEAQAETRKKAIDLLVSVVGQADGLRSPENRARIKSNAAEVLWEADEKKARSVFASVVDDIKAGFNEYESAPNDPDSNRYQTLEDRQDFMVFWQLRVDTVDRIAKHDPELALDVLKATRPSEAIKLPGALNAGEAVLSVRLANQVAAKSPQLALKIGRESLAHGFSNDLVLVLLKMRRKDRDTAQTFYLAIIDKLRDANFSNDDEALGFALSLVRNYRPPDADEQGYRDVLGMILKYAMDQGCNTDEAGGNPGACYSIRSIVPELQKYYAQRSAPLKRWAPGEQEPEYYGDPAEVNDLVQNGTADELLALAGRYPQSRATIYWQAFMKTAEKGDLDKARKIASEAPDEEMRTSMLSQLSEAEKMSSKSEERIKVIQKTLSELRTDEERIQFLASVATWLSTQDRKAALDLMDQASRLVDNAKPEKVKLKGQVDLAIAYAYMKSRRGFVLIESIIPKLNQLVTSAMGLDGVETFYVRDEEWNMSNNGVIGGLLADIAANAGYFAALDFDRSVSLAAQLERPELRLMAELKIAQGVFRAPGQITFRRTYYSRW